jgi:hypothetical protein
MVAIQFPDASAVAETVAGFQLALNVMASNAGALP